MQAIFAKFDFMALAAAGLAGLAVLALGAAVSSLLKNRDPVSRRLEALDDSRGDGKDSSLGRSLRGIAMALLARISRPAQPQKNWEASRVRRDLLVAGFSSENAVQVYLGSKVLLALAVPAALWLLTPISQRLQGPLLVLALNVAACVAYILPSFYLEAVSQRRKERVVRELPEVLDLLVIAVEAGLGLDAAIRRVSKEIGVSSPIMADELAMVSLELKAGIARDQALRNLAQRTGVDEVAGLVSMLNQADRFGVSVGRSLRVHSDSVRTKWRQKMEEKAAKIPLKLLFPVLFMIFPAILVVMAGPAIIRVSESILK